MTNTNRVTIRETDTGFHVRCAGGLFGIHICVQTLIVATRIKQVLKTMPHGEDRNLVIDSLIRSEAELPVVPPVRLRLVWSR